MVYWDICHGSTSNTGAPAARILGNQADGHEKIRQCGSEMPARGHQVSQEREQLSMDDVADPDQIPRLVVTEGDVTSGLSRSQAAGKRRRVARRPQWTR